MTHLSPAAQAVLDTTYNTFDLQDSSSLRKTVAAALRTAVDQVVPEGYTQAYDCCLEIMGEIREELLAIAAELEGAND